MRRSAIRLSSMNDCPYCPYVSFVTFPRAASASSGTKRLREKILLVVLANLLCGSLAFASDLTLAVGGKVSIELLSSDAEFHNTLTIASPAVSVALTGCKLETAPGMGSDVRILSEKLSQHGCRVTLDADPGVSGIQPFGAGTAFQFRLCAQTDADPDCENIWSSDPSANSDGFEHLTTTSLHPVDFPDRIFELAWEDLPDGGDFDFNDLIAVVRVEQDSDGDGLWDDWEKFGIDTTGDGTIDLDLPGLGANPLHKDIFVEIDWLDCTLTGSDCPSGDTHSHKPRTGVVEAVVQSFANANVTNPDGLLGITLHVDVNNGIAHREFVGLGCASGTGFDDIKVDPANFGPDNSRRFAYHYALFVHRQSATDGGSSGCGELGGNDFEVALGEWAKNGTFMEQAGTLMHELGHNLGLRHGGGDGVNYKPNYQSVMNYTYQLSGIPPTDPDGPGPLTAKLDYSKTRLADLDETNLYEPVGIGSTTADTVSFTCPSSAWRDVAGNLAIDWNCSRFVEESRVSNDINADRTCIGPGKDKFLDTAAAGDDVVKSFIVIWDGADRTCDSTKSGDDDQIRGVGQVEPNPLTGHWDWGNLKYDFQNAFDYEDGSHTSVEEQELDFSKLLNGPLHRNVPDGEQAGMTTTGALRQLVPTLSPGQTCTARFWAGKRSDGGSTGGSWYLQLTSGPWVETLLNGSLSFQSVEWQQYQKSFKVPAYFPAGTISLQLTGYSGFESYDLVELDCGGGNLIVNGSFEIPAILDGRWSAFANPSPAFWTVIPGAGPFNPNTTQLNNVFP